MLRHHLERLEINKTKISRLSLFAPLLLLVAVETLPSALVVVSAPRWVTKWAARVRLIEFRFSSSFRCLLCLLIALHALSSWNFHSPRNRRDLISGPPDEPANFRAN